MDIVGKKFNKLLVLERAGANKSRNILWKCQCDCGNIVIVAANHLRDGHTKSCGCVRKIDLSNKIFGRLKVIRDSGARSRGNTVIWECKCLCGNTVFVDSRSLIRGHTKSCGCLKKEVAAKLCSSRCGELSPSWKGGKSFEPYCVVWKDKEYKNSIKERDGYKCINPACNSKNPDNLVIHHINYDKKDCRPQNLVTLCCSCNVSANRDRSWHESWYKALMYNRCKYTVN